MGIKSCSACNRKWLDTAVIGGYFTYDKTRTYSLDTLKSIKVPIYKANWRINQI